MKEHTHFHVEICDKYFTVGDIVMFFLDYYVLCDVSVDYRKFRGIIIGTEIPCSKVEIEIFKSEKSNFIVRVKDLKWLGV